jgi:hypothetical protein
MPTASLAAVIAILVIASLGAGYLAGSGVDQTETRTVTSTTTIAKTVTSVSTSTAGTGQPIQAADVEAANISLGGAGGPIVAVDANASRIYALGWPVPGAYSLNDSLTVINASSNVVVANVSLPRTPAGYCYDLAVDDSTGMVYAILPAVLPGDNLAGEIVAVSGSTDAVTGEVTLSLGIIASNDFTCGETSGMALDSSTHVLWGPVNGSVIGVNVSTGSAVESIPLVFNPFEVAVDPYTGMVYADGCVEATADVCGSQYLAIINGSSGSLVTTVDLDSPIYGPMTMNPSTDIVYVTGGSQLVAVNGTNGNVIFRVYPETCGPSSIAVIPSLDQVVMVPTNYNYLLVYEGATGTLLNMYSFSSMPSFAGYDANAGELYVSASGDLLALHDVQATGNVNATLVDVGCGAP